MTAPCCVCSVIIPCGSHEQSLIRMPLQHSCSHINHVVFITVYYWVCAAVCNELQQMITMLLSLPQKSELRKHCTVDHTSRIITHGLMQQKHSKLYSKANTIVIVKYEGHKLISLTLYCIYCITRNVSNYVWIILVKKWRVNWRVDLHPTMETTPVSEKQ